jgi:hypothetical protein
MKLLKFAAVPLALLLAASTASTASAEVQVTIHDGLVTILAKDATVRQIIAEWARVGQAKVVNAERIPGGPMTLELTNVPEAQALDTLLRSAAGYLAAPRAQAADEQRAEKSRPGTAADVPAAAVRAAGRRRRGRRSAGAERRHAESERTRPRVQHLPAAAGREPADRRPRADAFPAAARAGSAAADDVPRFADRAIRRRRRARDGRARSAAAARTDRAARSGSAGTSAARTAAQARRRARG